MRIRSTALPNATVAHSSIDVAPNTRIQMDRRCFIGHRHAPPHGEGEDDCERERALIFIPEREAVVALDRFREKQQDADPNHEYQSADDSWLGVACEFGYRLALQAESEQSEIDEQHGAADDARDRQVEASMNGKSQVDSRIARLSARPQFA
jgi:hypothetical protein